MNWISLVICAHSFVATVTLYIIQVKQTMACWFAAPSSCIVEFMNRTTSVKSKTRVFTFYVHINNDNSFVLNDYSHANIFQKLKLIPSSLFLQTVKWPGKRQPIIRTGCTWCPEWTGPVRGYWAHYSWTARTVSRRGGTEQQCWHFSVRIENVYLIIF